MIENIIISKLEKIEQLSMLAAKNVLTIEDASILTGLAKSSIYRMTSQRQIPHSKRGNSLYFNRKELEDWMLEYRVKTKKECDQEAAAYFANDQRTSQRHSKRR